ncbi:Uncharacterized protein DAT39_000090, partial [Clarias magur]
GKHADPVAEKKRDQERETYSQQRAYRRGEEGGGTPIHSRETYNCAEWSTRIS